jgi:hypothetical protein
VTATRVDDDLSLAPHLAELLFRRLVAECRSFGEVTEDTYEKIDQVVDSLVPHRPLVEGGWFL